MYASIFRTDNGYNSPNLVDQLKFNSEREISFNLRNQNQLTEPKALRKYGENTFVIIEIIS
ncbi:hypothetical protein BpHYR1_039592 [Brachionus plicatilis]|uniref:Uncharacterized protein n=1 Tax=Brachionus plicatilis TaxID=10195 RepID=A0A3M7Q8T6_BRAPC|nr:hypothetical protein BpHYR1_039592 [Brachionus plicatilis]